MLNEPKKRILVLDDEQYICRIIVESLGNELYDIAAFTDPAQALEYISLNPVDLVLTDLVMGDYSGLQVIEATLENHPDAIVILMTAHPTVQTAISVLKRGAYDFLVKPFKLELLNATIRRGLNHQRVLRDNLNLKSQVEFLTVANSFFGSGQDINAYLRQLLQSCNLELDANASAILEMDPVTGEVVRRVDRCQERFDSDAVLNDALLQHFRENESRDIRMSAEPMSLDGRQMHLITIAHPIYIRNKLHGVMNVQLYSRSGSVPHGRLDILSLLANSAASAIANERLYRDLQTSYLNAIGALANAIDARDRYTAGHTERVMKLAELLATELGWSPREIHHLHMGCTLHDIGKIGVPDAILNKAGRLTQDEARIMRNHPRVGAQIIAGIDIFQPGMPYIMCHHERYDGNGYPEGLKGEDIPIEGRLLSVVDTFDAIMSDRPYRKGADLSIAVSELAQNAGGQFDPNLVRLFLKILGEGKIDLVELYGHEYDTACIAAAFRTTRTVSA